MEHLESLDKRILKIPNDLSDEEKVKWISENFTYSQQIELLIRGVILWNDGYELDRWVVEKARTLQKLIDKWVEKDFYKARKRTRVYLSGNEVLRLKKTPEGWEWGDRKYTRPTRSNAQAFVGQAIWYLLVKYHFVSNRGSIYGGGLDPFEKKLKSWLIVGYWEKESSGERIAREWEKGFLKRYHDEHKTLNEE